MQSNAHRGLGIVVLVGFWLSLTPPAAAVHLFPLTPTSDPLGHDCAKALTPNPGTSNSTVRVAGFSFLDTRSNTSTTSVVAGQTVTWTWAIDHCHSVTFEDGRGTRGAPGFMPANQEQLVRLNGSGQDSFTLTFATPGTYRYSCVHHAAVGMTGSVIVAAATAAPSSPPAETPPAPDPPPSPPANRPGELPTTGAGTPLGPVAALAFGVAILARRGTRRC